MRLNSIALGVSLIFAVACGESRSRLASGAAGAASGAGGKGGDGPSAGGQSAGGQSAGGQSAAGEGGDGHTAGGYGAGGEGGSGPRCEVLPRWWPAQPFALTAAEHSAGAGGASNGGEAGASGEGGAFGGAYSGCSYSSSSPSVLNNVCNGEAKVRAASGSLSLELADGSVLGWDARFARGMPMPALADGSRVSLVYNEEKTILCAVCGSYYVGWALHIRSVTNGDVLWFGHAGKVLPLDDGTLRDLLGVDVRSESSCESEPYEETCYSVVAHADEHVVETLPEQRIPYDVATRVTVPNGTFDVSFATATFAFNRDSNCADGTPPLPGLDVAIGRVP